MTLKTLGPTATTNDVLAELDQAGAVIVKDVIGAQILERFNACLLYTSDAADD